MVAVKEKQDTIHVEIPNGKQVKLKSMQKDEYSIEDGGIFEKKTIVGQSSIEQPAKHLDSLTHTQHGSYEMLPVTGSESKEEISEF